MDTFIIIVSVLRLRKLTTGHAGGALLVRHGGNTMEFDWSGPLDSPKPAIQWAAFYSDCEHEILEVTSGHRITLTYNLFISRGAGMLTGHSLPMDSQQLLLYHVIENMLKNPDFIGEGSFTACAT